MKIAIIGGGAAGLTAAASAAEKGAKVTVYEHMQEPAKKILMTGNGKCNLTNSVIRREDYYTDSDEQDIVGRVLGEFRTNETVRWFWRHGLMTRERNGYIYPYSEQASAVRAVLIRSCEKAGVRLICGYDCYGKLKKTENGFLVGEEEYDRLILACGGKSARGTGSDGSGYELAKLFGHQLIEPKPALVQLHTELPHWKLMAGVRTQGMIFFPNGQAYPNLVEKHWKKTKPSFPMEEGELQFTEYGISGIPVFQLSRIVVRELYIEKQQKRGTKPVKEVVVDLFPDYNRNQIRCIIDDRISQYQKGTISQALTGLVHEKIIAYALKALGYDEYAMDQFKSRADEERFCNELAALLKDMKIPVSGSHKLDSAQVTQGGVPFTEVDERLQSRLVPGLFFAGEILDVDGRCGGYNLQWAWASGFTAAREALK